MTNLIKIIKSIKLKQVLTVLLASCLLTISTACSQNPIAQADGVVDNAKRAMSDTYDNYDANQGFKGGMNGYNDDRRYDASTAVKTKGLIDTARSRQQDNLGDYAEDIVDRAGNKIDEAKRDIPRTLQSNKEKAIDYVEDKSQNLQDNLSKVPSGTKKVFNQAVDNAQGTIEDVNRSTKETAREVSKNFQDLS